MPWLVATFALVVHVTVTTPHGLGVSLDSVVYIRAAESVDQRGTLDVPLTRWDARQSREPLSHFPPALPLTLAATGRAFGTAPITSSRWLNAVCLFVTVAALLLAVSGSGLAMFMMVALLVGPTFIVNYLWVWSEPLFLLVLVFVVRAAVSLVAGVVPARHSVWLGALCGLATLTRYAGIALFAGSMVALASSRLSRGVKARQLLGGAVAYVLTTLPWLWWLGTHSARPREIGFYRDHLWGQVVRPLLRTTTRWFVPSPLPLPVALALVVGALVLLALACARRARTSGGFTPGPVTHVAGTLLVVYVAFLLTARIVADPGMPFDERILSAAMVLTALALSDVLRTLFRTRPSMLAAALVACVAVSNVNGTARTLTRTVAQGLGYSNDTWKTSETVAWLARVPPGVTIFSNAPDAIAARLPVTAKYTPANEDTGRLSEFAARVASTAPSLVVLFEDPHAGWLVPRERLLAVPGVVWLERFADSVVVSWPSGTDR